MTEKKAVKTKKVSSPKKVKTVIAKTPTTSLRAKRSNLSSTVILGSKATPESKKADSGQVIDPEHRRARMTKFESKGGLTVPVFDISGKSAGTVTLPKEIFGQKPNKSLLAQAIRVYQANSIAHTAHTKTRGEVRGGGKKPWRQKGTGRARAGSSRSPLWVGGGVTFGPRKNESKLTLPQKMRHKALVYALSQQAQSKQIKVISGIEKIEPKTKTISNLLNKLEVKKNSIIIISQKRKNVKLASRNIQNLTLTTPQNLNAYQVLKNNQLLISKEAISLFK